MPQVFVYIRNEDLDKWKAIEKKAEFVHNALNRLPGSSEAADPLERLKGDIKRIESGGPRVAPAPPGDRDYPDWGA